MGPRKRKNTSTAEPSTEGRTATETTLQSKISNSMMSSFDIFVGNVHAPVDTDEKAEELCIASKIQDEYSFLDEYVPTEGVSKGGRAPLNTVKKLSKTDSSQSARIIDSIDASRGTKKQIIEDGKANQLVLASDVRSGVSQLAKASLTGTIMIPTATGGQKEYVPSATISKRAASKWPRPEWHAPWKTYRVISGHLGWVRSVAFDPSNEWFVTGSADRTIKVWDTASGQLKLTLTGHIEQVTGLAVSQRHPYMFSCGLDKQVKCWDLEQNKVIRNYHGHLSGVYSIALHPKLDILATGGRDATCRVWDMRSKTQIFALGGHEDNVSAILMQASDPQIITGSHDKTIKLWDLRTGKTLSTLTYHKKSVRALAAHPTQYTFASGGADNVKKFGLPQGEFLFNFLQNQNSIINAMAVNEDGVLATGGDNGSLWFRDWKSGNAFQETESVVQPGSLDSEAGIYAMSFDVSGTRLVTCEADKTIKMWKEDETATPETHPIDFQPPKNIRRY